MASLTKTKSLFGFTSPRTIEKSIPEIRLLIENFQGEVWVGNRTIQEEYYKLLRGTEYYSGDGPETQKRLNDGAGGRDRINRGPKALGFVSLSPTVQLTPAGEQLLSGFRLEEVYARQLMKFQLPSPNHTQSKIRYFNVKPYLELLRLIYDLGYLSKFEIAAFFCQLINYKDYNKIKKQILRFRQLCKEKRGLVNIKELKNRQFEKTVRSLWKEEIKGKNYKTREGKTSTYKGFVNKKKRDLMDYADAFQRYIRATGFISLRRNEGLRIVNEKKDEVLYLLSHIKRPAVVFSSDEAFYQYLGSNDNVSLLVDNKQQIKRKLTELSVEFDETDDLNELKKRLDKKYEEVKTQNIDTLISSLEAYDEYDDIIKTLERIKSGDSDLIDAPLLLEYNLWKAMVMLDHAVKVKGNFKMDSECMPISVAGARKPDIEILYQNFGLIIEATTAIGSKQYEMEGEPVARHYGDAKQSLHNDLYCIFVAKKLNLDALAYMYNTNRYKTRAYGGKTKIIPMDLDDFVLFVEATKDSKFSNEEQMKAFLEEMWIENQDMERDEIEWNEIVKARIPSWCSA